MLTHLLDASVYSQRLRPKPLPEVVRRWRKVGDQRLCISAICEAEIRYGLTKRGSERLWTEYRQFLEHQLVVLPVDKPVADRYGELKTELEEAGLPRAEFDLLIAATALHHNLILATCNLKHFANIPGLRVEDWR